MATDGPLLILTNDDGIDAPGLAALRQAASGLGRLAVIAPIGPRSGCGHAVTTHQPIRVISHAGDSWAVDGTPADCVRLALDRLAPSAAWVLSGVNAGGNLGLDLLHSGTAAAAREAALRGVPAVAVSHYIRKGLPLDWDRAATWTRRVLAELMAKAPAHGHFWNVNLPHLSAEEDDPETVSCGIDPSPLPSRYDWSGDLATYTGVYSERPRLDGLDVAICFGGRVAVSLVPAAGIPWPAPTDPRPVDKPFDDR